jgi:uncharacterized protein YbbC (DUF1343 family)/CubicO group peptidase (beta-lactamase class C family)
VRALLSTLEAMVPMRLHCALCALWAWVVSCACSAALAEPSAAALPNPRFAAIEAVVQQAIARGELPGCVVSVGTRAGEHYTRAFGERTAGEPMTTDTLFDLASLTKPLATATSIALLAERGAVALDQPVARYLSELNVPDKRRITPRQLLLHTSGLARVGPLSQLEHGVAEARARIAAMPLRSAPGKTFEYSDLGYILLGELVARVAGMPLDSFAERALFSPLQMRDTHFVLPSADRRRAAPTELRDDVPIRGVVDDPRAYRLGGVAGNAGVFSTAADVGRFARMLLNEGELEGVRVLTAQTVRRMLQPQPAGSAVRTLGFDVHSPYDHGRGLTMSDQAVGHGGYTGTSLWIDPVANAYVVLLSNRVHVGTRGTIHPLASGVADLALRALRTSEPLPLRTGIDVLHEEAYARLRGHKVALLTHAAARDRAGVGTLERIAAAPRLTLLSVLTPEHGLSGRHEGKVRDQLFRGLPVHSLFGKTRKPSAAMLRDVDTIVIDLVDVGTRFYTYMATALATIEAAGELGLTVMLLDRPNPIDGVHVEGPLSEPAFRSFVNYHPLPLRHGMTAGELARMLVSARALPTKLSIVQVEGYARTKDSRALGLPWHAPSPNLGSAEQALIYPATGLVEGTNVSVGRGTPRAFRVVGAPFIDGPALAQRLMVERLAGVRVAPTRFRPLVGPYAGTSVPGIELTIVDRQTYSAARTGLSLIGALRALYPSAWDTTRLGSMVAHQSTLEQLERGVPPVGIEASWQAELQRFLAQRSEFLLY